jgi:hypothetical protein
MGGITTMGRSASTPLNTGACGNGARPGINGGGVLDDDEDEEDEAPAAVAAAAAAAADVDGMMVIGAIGRSNKPLRP